MTDRRINTDVLWSRTDTEPRYVWVACCTRPLPGHARPVYRHQLDEPLLCETCRQPQKPMSKTAVERYKRGDRRCPACRAGDHGGCCGVGCYGCDRELHRRTGVLATRTTNGDVDR